MTASTLHRINALQTYAGVRVRIRLQEMDQLPKNKDVSKAGSAKPKLLDQVRIAIRGKHYSRRTEQAYIHRIKRFIYFTGKRHPREMGAPEITEFLNDLADRHGVAAATQNRALSALLFLYQQVLRFKLPWLDGLVRAKRPLRLPTVLTMEEARVLLAQLDGAKWLMASLLYGAGLRLHELGCEHDHDLHSRHEQGRTRSKKPA